MEKFPLKVIPLDRLIVTPFGSITPKCNTCKTVDCGYRIEWRVVSRFGVNKKMRCIINGQNPAIVAECEGYSD